LCSALSPAHADDQLKPWVLLGGRVTMLVPQGMALMSESDKAEKYTNPEPPAYVLSTEDWLVNITFDLKKIPLKPQEVRENEKPMRQTFSRSKINSSSVRKINGVEFVILNVDIAAGDATVHNLMAMTSLDDRMLLISYNCVLDVDPACGEIGPRIIESIVLKPSAPAQ
jgi:hypothetical protein